jgi:hypothetical protein
MTADSVIFPRCDCKSRTVRAAQGWRLWGSGPVAIWRTPTGFVVICPTRPASSRPETGSARPGTMPADVDSSDASAAPTRSPSRTALSLDLSSKRHRSAISGRPLMSWKAKSQAAHSTVKGFALVLSSSSESSGSRTLRHPPFLRFEWKAYDPPLKIMRARSAMIERRPDEVR